MKTIAFNGSARKDGNTAIMSRWVFDELEKEGIATDKFIISEDRAFFGNKKKLNFGKN